MFIYSIRASSVKFFGALALSLITLLVLIAVIPGGGDVTADADASGKTIVYTGVKNSGDGAEFLAQFGWVVSDCTESEQITVPAEFDDALEEYNALQIEQGLDLKKYRRKKVDRYTYEITNYPDSSGKVRASILVYRGRVIGGDVSTADAAGFTVPLAGGGAKGADKLG